MAVPRMSQLRKGVGVNIILKADQRTGTLTSGSILDILTRGDHPRGIKVRLTDGRIGRVQSLTPSHEVAGAQSVARHGAGLERDNNGRGHSDSCYSSTDRGQREGQRPPPDHRLDRAPHESLSLLDYVRMPSSNTSGMTSETGEITTQEQLELEFPKLDSALISAILLDYPETTEARKVLSSLS